MSKINKPAIGKIYKYTGHVYDTIFMQGDKEIVSEFKYECRLILLDYFIDESRYEQERAPSPYWFKTLIDGKLKYCWLRNIDDFENHYKHIFEIINSTIPVIYTI